MITDDSNKNEIKIPENHLIVMGKNSFCFFNVNECKSELIYKKPNCEKFKEYLKLFQHKNYGN